MACRALAVGNYMRDEKRIVFDPLPGFGERVPVEGFTRNKARTQSLLSARLSSRASGSACYKRGPSQCRLARDVCRRSRPQSHIRQIRKALGDNPTSPRFIETAHRQAIGSSVKSQTAARCWQKIRRSGAKTPLRIHRCAPRIRLRGLSDATKHCCECEPGSREC